MMGKIVIWIILMLIVFGISTAIQETYAPSSTTDVAVDQLKNSDEAYVELREHEMVRNWIEVIVWFAAALITIALFFNDTKKFIQKRRQKMVQTLDNSPVKHVDCEEV